MSTTPRDPTTRFSDRVDDYERYRPGYPPALLDRLMRSGALAPSSVVADVGAGTGISSEFLLGSGCKVVAVEPNAEMRAAAERRLARHPRFRSVAGRAEATTLANASVDFVAAGTAFHWFEPAATREEFLRILRPGSRIALFWNVRGLESAFMREYEALLGTYCAEYAAKSSRERADETAIETLFGGAPVERTTFANAQALDFGGLRGRLLSSSYAPRAGDPAHEPMLAALGALFERHEENGRVAMDYDTRLIVGRPRAADEEPKRTV